MQNNGTTTNETTAPAPTTTTAPAPNGLNTARRGRRAPAAPTTTTAAPAPAPTTNEAPAPTKPSKPAAPSVSEAVREVISKRAAASLNAAFDTAEDVASLRAAASGNEADFRAVASMYAIGASSMRGAAALRKMISK